MRPGCPGVRARDTGTLFLIFMSSLIVGRLGYGALSMLGRVIAVIRLTPSG